MPKKKTFEQAKKEIFEKYPYLELLKFNGNKKIALFLDKEYGEFEGNYKTVLLGKKNHPKRAKINKQLKRKKTCLEKYGVENAAKSIKIKEKVKKTCLKKYGCVSHNSSEIIKKKKINTFQNKYGTQSPFQITEVKEKIKKSNLEKYGVEHPFQSKEIQEKIKQTNLQKYGVEYPSQLEFIKRKIKNTCINKYGTDHHLKNNQILKKQIKTVIERYQVCNISKLKNVKESKRISSIKKYGVETPLQSKEIKEKIKKSNLEKYGVEHPFKSKEIQEIIKQTNLQKYGFKVPSESPLIKNKIKQTILNNGNCYNINGISLMEYYNNSELNKFGYSTIQSNYKKYGKVALKKDHYNLLHGKSKIANLWLEQIEKELGYELIREYHIPNTLYRADGYDPKTNTIYEFYGDYWHGNLNNIHPVKKKTFQEVYNDTIKKENKIKSLGYNIISIWEKDFL